MKFVFYGKNLGLVNRVLPLWFWSIQIKIKKDWMTKDIFLNIPRFKTHLTLPSYCNKFCYDLQTTWTQCNYFTTIPPTISRQFPNYSTPILTLDCRAALIMFWALVTDLGSPRIVTVRSEFLPVALLTVIWAPDTSVIVLIRLPPFPITRPAAKSVQS